MMPLPLLIDLLVGTQYGSSVTSLVVSVVETGNLDLRPETETEIRKTMVAFHTGFGYILGECPAGLHAVSLAATEVLCTE